MVRLLLSLLILAAIWVGIVALAAVPAVVPLELTIAAAGPISVAIQDRLLGLPPIPGATNAPRPDWMMPAPFNDVADSTIVRRTFRF